MASYYLNRDDTQNPYRNHEVHKEGCIYMPASYHREFLGYFNDARFAVAEAKALGYRDADGCATCCPEAHHE